MRRAFFVLIWRLFSVNIVKLLEIDCAVQCEIQLVLCFQTCAAKWNCIFILYEIIAHFDLLFHQCVCHHFTTAGGGWTPKWTKKTVVCSSCSVKYLLFVQVSISSFVLGWNIFHFFDEQLRWRFCVLHGALSAAWTQAFVKCYLMSFHLQCGFFLCTFLSAGGFSLLYQFDGLFCIL